eukprot:gene8055-biopygen1556
MCYKGQTCTTRVSVEAVGEGALSLRPKREGGGTAPEGNVGRYHAARGTHRAHHMHVLCQGCLFSLGANPFGKPLLTLLFNPYSQAASPSNPRT